MFTSISLVHHMWVFLTWIASLLHHIPFPILWLSFSLSWLCRGWTSCFCSHFIVTYGWCSPYQLIFTPQEGEPWHILSLLKFFHFTAFLMSFVIKKRPSPGWMGMPWTRNPSSVSSYLALKISLPSSTTYTFSRATNSFSFLSVCSAYSLSEDDSSSLTIELPDF